MLPERPWVLATPSIWHCVFVAGNTKNIYLMRTKTVNLIFISKMSVSTALRNVNFALVICPKFSSFSPKLKGDRQYDSNPMSIGLFGHPWLVWCLSWKQTKVTNLGYNRMSLADICWGRWDILKLYPYPYPVRVSRNVSYHYIWRQLEINVRLEG